MAQVRNPYGEDRVVPWLGGKVVQADEVTDVPDDLYDAFLASGWEPVIEPSAKSKHRPATSEE